MSVKNVLMTVCDRCGQSKLGNNRKDMMTWARTTLAMNNKRFKPMHTDLCEDCVTLYYQFMNATPLVTEDNIDEEQEQENADS